MLTLTPLLFLAWLDYESLIEPLAELEKETKPAETANKLLAHAKVTEQHKEEITAQKAQPDPDKENKVINRNNLPGTKTQTKKVQAEQKIKKDRSLAPPTPTKVTKPKKQFKKMPTDQAMEILLENGFLPQLPAVRISNHFINRQISSKTSFQGVDFLEAKKPVLLHFWATWCGPCKKELPSFAEFVSAQGVFDVYTITSELNNEQSKANKIWDFYTEKSITGLNVCADSNGKLAFEFGISGIPATLLISADGFLLGRFIGATEWEKSDLIEALISYMM